MNSEKKSSYLTWARWYLRDWAAQPWTSLRQIGTSKTAKLSAVWFFVIPMFVKVGEWLPGSVTLPMSGNDITLALAVPFSWLALFFAAACFTFGNVVFACACPRVIKSYRDYQEFHEATGGAEGEIRYQYANVIWQMPDGEHRALTQDFAESYCSGRGGYLDPDDLLLSYVIVPAKAPNAFAKLLRDADQLKKKARVLCTCVYALGFVCLGIVFWTTFRFVTWYALGL